MEEVKKITSGKDTLFIMIDDFWTSAGHFVFYIVDGEGNKKSSYLLSKCATKSVEKVKAFKEYFIKHAVSLETLKEKQIAKTATSDSINEINSTNNN